MATGNLVFDYSGYVVLVTGGARGIGLEVGRAFVAWGAVVYLVDIDQDELKSAADEAGARAIAADVTSSADVQRVLDRVMADEGRLDVLINNAGIVRDGVVWKLTDDDWESVLATHAGGTFKFTRAAIPLFRRQNRGRIINVTSYTGLRGNFGQANYSTAKAGIIGFTKTTAKELAHFGITVNAISPNADTRMVAGIPDNKKAELAAAIPMARFASPQEMAPAVGFLASDEAAYITGVVLPIDGGISI